MLLCNYAIKCNRNSVLKTCYMLRNKKGKFQQYLPHYRKRKPVSKSLITFPISSCKVYIVCKNSENTVILYTRILYARQTSDTLTGMYKRYICIYMYIRYIYIYIFILYIYIYYIIYNYIYKIYIYIYLIYIYISYIIYNYIYIYNIYLL